MKVNKSITIELTSKEVTEAIKDYLDKKGYDTETVEFIVKKEVDNSDFDDRFHTEWYVFDKAVCKVTE